MHDSLGMRGLQSVGDLNRQYQQHLGFDRLSADPVFQRHPVEIFHRDKSLAVLLPISLNRQVFGLVQAGGGLGSRRNRSIVAGSPATSSGRNLMATKRSSRVSSALYTTPIPPPPSFSTMR